jgi:hypothetical protein
MRRILAATSVVLTMTACESRVAESPTPAFYAWPERVDYRLEQVSELQRDARAVQRAEVHKLLRFSVRDGEYVMVYDSVLKFTVTGGGGGAQLGPYLPEDTLAFHVALGRRGELGRVVAGCDPALPACAAVYPSSVAMELRRFIPGLPIWPIPPGGTWEDSLRFDDTARPGGTRGTMVTRYGPVRDTTIGGVAYWLVPWHASKVAFRRATGGSPIAAERPPQDDGVALIDKARLLPVISSWAGATGAPPELQAIGVEAGAFRARAYLVGTSFDSAFARNRPQAPVEP